MERPPPPPHDQTILTREPVRVAWVAFGFVQAVTTILLATEVISQVAGAVIIGVTTAIYGAISELFVRAEVVPLRPLEALAAEEATAPAPAPVNAQTERYESAEAAIHPAAEAVAEQNAAPEIVEQDRRQT